ncbi:hypothetical protein IV203_016603 [Nitzschia inconspicua]|uniref:Uncharacterized protein n=1 Tax=Nitzschia inconspicua TaxID=303405 RepID=A0A9K3KRQ5_9STRA|nr:hypothetical protein IV203_016603 [Nitzschia inconspicua]
MVTLPDFGSFNVYWFACLEDASAKAPSKIKVTPKSAMSEILCEASIENKSRAQLPDLVSRARKVHSTIRNSLNQWNAWMLNPVMFTSKPKEWNQRYSHLNHRISSGREITESLLTTLKQVGYAGDAALSRQRNSTSF